MTYTETYRTQLIDTLNGLDLGKVDTAIEILREARDNGNTIFMTGNGGSAASASHFVCDMLKGASYQKDKRFKILSLHDNMPTLTAYSNDVDYHDAALEQLKNFGSKGDVVIAISGSGNSPNVLRAVEYANSIGCKTIAFTGRDGGKLGPLAQLEIRTTEPHMGRIEDAHMIALHMMCYQFMDVKE
ncbi:SIS domain-containing protein [Bryobacter aggregatus]|uniref:SIS domain-containing protein n=1 Tax=Bryobacter aggregatus TaxID=360054 RepID=UPI0004E237A0|nr:SIS domain-containing protein [Bryobacter aggregatus]